MSPKIVRWGEGSGSGAFLLSLPISFSLAGFGSCSCERQHCRVSARWVANNKARWGKTCLDDSLVREFQRQIECPVGPRLQRKSLLSSNI